MNNLSLSQDPEEPPGSKIGDAILKLLGHIPTTSESLSATPEDRGRTIARNAALRASATAGALALPPGPLNWLTILPELLVVWRIQAQMVADLAGVYGKTSSLSQSHMIYCLFKHGATMALRDIVVQVGDRYLVKRVTKQALQRAARKIGIQITQKAAAKGVARWIPVAGAIGVGGYAFFDTAQVAKSAIKLFQSEITIEEE